MKTMRHVSLILAFLLLCGVPGRANIRPVGFDADRNRIIAYMLSHQLPAQHYSHIPLDDELSRRAYTLYLRRLDPRKRFLLARDVEQLDAFRDHIDDELQRGRMILPDAGRQILDERVRQVADRLDFLMNQGFEPDREEYLESDPKKIAWAPDRKGLEARWRLILKSQVLDEYLSLAEKAKKQTGATEKKTGGGQDASADRDGTIVDSPRWRKAMETVRKRNHQYLKRLLEETRQDYYNRYFDAVARAFDPHTNYMPPTSKEDFDIHMSGSLEGIGALLREDDGHIKVVRIIPGSAAERQGQLQAEDIILSVAEKGKDPVSITDMRIREAVSYIRGPKGTEVILTVRKPDGSRQVIPIVRDVVQIEETYVKSVLLTSPGGRRIGYVKIPSFYRDFNAARDRKQGRNVTDDTRHALRQLEKKGAIALILDVRNNGGGALSDAVDISGLFLADGPMVQVRNSQGMTRILDDDDPSVVFSGPLIILVNQFSASASEILAAALQDYHRALIIGGEHTHGKGTVQALVDLNRNLPLLHLKKYDDLGALKITIQKFYRVTGGSTQYRGVEPDIVAPSMLDYMETGEKYLDYSLPWDTTASVPYLPWTGAGFALDRARKLGQDWIARSETFTKIRQEAEKARQRKRQTRVPVFLQGMKQERLEAEKARQEAIAAGLVESEEDKKDGGRPLSEQLARDPYVGLALFLMDRAMTTGGVK